MSLTGATPCIFLVEQSNLNRSSVKARAEVFQADFLHLTNKKGLGFNNTNIINAINECYPDTKDLKNNNNYSEDISKTKDQPYLKVEDLRPTLSDHCALTVSLKSRFLLVHFVYLPIRGTNTFTP